MPRLRVVRDRGWVDKLRAYRIPLDGAEVGRISEGGELRREIGEGHHVIEARIDWCGNQPLGFEAQPGEQVVLVRSGLRSWRSMLGLFYVIFNPRGYLTLELEREEDGQGDGGMGMNARE